MVFITFSNVIVRSPCNAIHREWLVCHSADTMLVPNVKTVAEVFLFRFRHGSRWLSFWFDLLKWTLAWFYGGIRVMVESQYVSALEFYCTCSLAQANGSLRMCVCVCVRCVFTTCEIFSLLLRGFKGNKIPSRRNCLDKLIVEEIQLSEIFRSRP